MSRPPVAIVGGGVTGLYLAWRLAQEGRAVRVFEAFGLVGGRYRTVRSELGMYEAGAWRVSAGHPKTLKLLESLGLETKKLSTEAPPAASERRCEGLGPGVSMRTASLVCASAPPDERGYHGMSAMASLSRSYGVGGRGTSAEDKTYYYIREGFSAVTEKLLSLLPPGTVELNCRVRLLHRDAAGRWELSGLRRSLRFRTSEGFSSVVCCVPPHALPQVEGDDDVFAPLRASVRAVELVHVYAPAPTGLKYFKVTTEAPISQVIGPASEGSAWWQPCYASGRDARFWNELYVQDREAFRKELERQLREALSGHEEPVLGQLVASLKDARAHYWERAVHIWKPSPGLRLPCALRLAMQPSYARHPRLFVAGEAVSLNQGWTEGCLETADLLLPHLLSEAAPVLPAPRRSPEFLFQGMPLFVPVSWFDRHPGSRKALENHLGEDISLLWPHVHSTGFALRTLFSLLSAVFHSPKS